MRHQAAALGVSSHLHPCTPGAHTLLAAAGARTLTLLASSCLPQVASYPGRPGDSSHWTWRTFDDKAASVACRQLGLETPGRLAPNATTVYGEGKGPVHLSGVVCLGGEAGLQSCAHSGVGSAQNKVSSFGHKYDVGIVCNGAPLP